MNPSSDDSHWTKKGATLSNKTAEKEFGLTFQEIVDGLNADKLQYRQTIMYGNPSLRLLRQEVEALVAEMSPENPKSPQSPLSSRSFLRFSLCSRCSLW
jgi:hypothetical protein